MHNDALPTALILLLLLCWGISHTIQRRASLLTSIATIGIICSLALFLPSGAQARFLTISLPFFTLLLGCAYFELQKQLLHTKIPVLMILVIFGITETFYSINTNLILNPHGTAGIAYAKDHFYSRGYHELDQYLRSTVYGQLPHRKKIQTIADAKVGVDESFDGSIIIDDRMNWFSSMWYFRRYQFYYDRPIVALPFILQRMHDEAWGNNLFTYLQSKGAKKVWLITINEAIDGAQKKSMEYTLYAASLEKVLQEADISPHSIDLYGGQPAVNIYTIPL
jgi:hypothetical protein